MINIVATFGWRESNGAGESVSTPTNINFGSDDSTDLTPSSYPISAGSNSYEKWIRGYWSGTFTTIDNIKFWKSAGSYVTGESITFGGNNISYATPTTDTSTVATSAVPTSEPGSANVSIGGSLSGQLSTTGYSDYIVLQTQITSGASAGATNTKTFTLQYDET